MAQLEIAHLSYRFSDGSYGIQDIHLEIQRGEFVVIAGANGSGKTTLCRHLNGLLSPSAGEVRLDGKPVAKQLKKARQIIGMVFQDADSQIVGETVADDIAFGPENLNLCRTEITARVLQRAKEVGLDQMLRRHPHSLSGGEKRKLALAGVLAMNPELVVLDEPFSNLDYPSAKQVHQLLRRLSEDGCTLIVVTHELGHVFAEADRLIILQRGRVVRDGIPTALLDSLEAFDIRKPCTCEHGKGW